MTASRGTNESAWFVADDPVRDPKRDAFGHADVAGNLLAMIRNPASGRRMIGLVGPFGVGKSTVIELLRQSLQGDSGKVVIRVSAERHEMEDFHRSFVFSIAEELVEHGHVKRADADTTLEGLEYASTRSWSELTLSPFLRMVRRAFRGVRESVWKRVAIVAAAALGALIVLTVVLAALGFFGNDTAVAILAWVATSIGVLTLSASIPLVATVWTSLKRVIEGSNLLAPGQATAFKPRAEAADEYERTFARLAGLVNKQLIIAVDDVDRMAASDILPALNAIRTFQLTVSSPRRPVFIVSVDERIVANAINDSSGLPDLGGSRREVVDEYLNRLFTLRQHMPPHVPGDLKQFAREVLTVSSHEGARKLGVQLDSVLNVLIHADVSDPRHVVRILNAFFGDYRLAARREQHAGGKRAIARGIVTSNPITLARFTVLKVDHSAFYLALTKEMALLEAVERAVRGDIDAHHAELFELHMGDLIDSTQFERLRRFIGRTATWTENVDDLLPFLYLGQTELERTAGSGDARSARALLANRQIVDAREFLAGAISGDTERRSAIASFVGESTRSLEGLELNNAIEVLAENAEIVIELDRSLGAAVADALYRAPSSSPAVSGLISLLPTLETDQQRDTIAAALGRPPAGADDEWAATLLRRRSEIHRYPVISRAAERFLQDQVETYKESRELGDIEAMLPHFTNDANSDLAPSILGAVFQAVARSDEDLSDDGVESVSGVAAVLGEEKLVPELKSAMQAILAEGVTSNASKAVLALLDSRPNLDPQPIADLGWAFVRGAMDVKESTLRDGFTHREMERGAGLLSRMISEANGHTAQKARLAAHSGNLLAAAITKWETTYPSMNGLFSAAAAKKPSDMTPVVKAHLELWAQKEDRLDADEIALLRLIVQHVDGYSADTAELIWAAISAAAEPSATSDQRADVLEVLQDALVSERGASWVSPLISSNVAHLSSTRSTTVAAAEVILIAARSGVASAADAAAVLAALQSRVIPYGLHTEALDLLLSYPWPQERAAESMALIEAAVGGASDAHLLATFDLLSTSAPGTSSATLTRVLATNLPRLAQDSSNHQRLTGIFTQQENEELALSALQLGDAAVSALQRRIDDMSDDARQELAGSMPRVAANVDPHAHGIESIIRAVDSRFPLIVADSIQDLVIEQVLQDGDVYTTETYGALLRAAGDQTHQAVARTLASAFSDSAGATLRALPVLGAIETAIEFDTAIADVVADAIRRWGRDEPDESVAMPLAKVTQVGRTSKARALSKLGARGPRSEPGRSVYLATRSVLRS